MFLYLNESNSKHESYQNKSIIFLIFFIKISGTATPNIEEEDSNKVENWPEQTQRQPMKPLMDPQVVQEFLLGQHCLYGGSGWWKYEFCYGQKVDQYHEEKGPHGPQKTVLNLGKNSQNLRGY